MGSDHKLPSLPVPLRSAASTARPASTKKFSLTYLSAEKKGRREKGGG